ncbi:MAG: secondary thiamine-phosphate synthase enzyme YjbQ [Vicinamibacterales bacterium]
MTNALTQMTELLVLRPHSPGVRTRATTRHAILAIDTPAPVACVDITNLVESAVDRTGLVCGTVNIQTRHTTTGVMINEHEPLLLSDLEAMFERLAPRTSTYLHDDFARRAALEPDERRNGHAHCRAALLRASECVNVVGARLALGRWQRVFLVELDGPRRREISLLLAGRRSDRRVSATTRP